MTALPDIATASLAVLDSDDARWRHHVEGDPAALVFHHPAWMALIRKAYGFRTFVLGLEDATGGLVGGVPVAEISTRIGGRRWVALPFTDHCPPLGLDGAPAAEMLTEARVRAGVSRLELHAELEGPGAFPAEEAVHHVLALQEDADAVRRTFHKSHVLRSIKKADKAGVVVRRATSPADVTGTFYRLHTGTRRRLGVPVQPRRFFTHLWEQVLEPGLGFVLIAEAEGKPVAGAVFLAHGDTVIYKYGASEADAWSLRPNHAIFWDAIRSSCESGYRRFDFGRSDLGHSTLRQFKSSWGSEELPLRYSTLADEAPEPGSGRAARALVPIVQHSPRWVCRLLGELLYKHAA
jgi:CelD/BcsL family acetyltransferase involved in cellulose biosynthesis